VPLIGLRLKVTVLVRQPLQFAGHGPALVVHHMDHGK
jgi:hypothetical protein